MNCRFCGGPLEHEFIDLGSSPPSNSFLTRAQLNEPEVYYPLKLYVCGRCWLVQIDEYKKADEIFNSHYRYFSSFSSTWLEHSRHYAEMITERLGLGKRSLVVEVASNDGYLLQYFKQMQIPCLGIEPAENTAAAARAKGIECICEFFGRAIARRLAAKGKCADLVIANNVLAHVPDVHDFVAALTLLVKPEGTITVEFPHLMRLVELKQFDTIYHEHFSYFSLGAVREIFATHGLAVHDVEPLTTHGGSLRVYASRESSNSCESDRMRALLEEERSRGMRSLAYYQSFQEEVDCVKNELLAFLIHQKRSFKKVLAYGAAAKGNTFLNYCGVRRDLIPWVVDASSHKQGTYLPGSHIPVTDETAISRLRPDFVLILAWNLKQEIMRQLEYVRRWNGRFVTAIPHIEVM
jgi:SAM-dependent methyltransferase